MQQRFFTITKHEEIAAGVWRMCLSGDVSDTVSPGQFINVTVDGFFLRRPISVCDRDKDGLTIVYKVVGDGTRAMTELAIGAQVDVLTGLGNGFDLTCAGDRPVLFAGGIGSAPLFWLARELRRAGKDVTVVMGFNTKSEFVLEQDYRDLGCRVIPVTVDGTYGAKGFVTDVLDEANIDAASFFYACGPEPMMKAINRVVTIPGQFSLEERMGCGFGACMGCSCHTTSGPKRICKEGPVFMREELPWE